jgi:Uma2 family endonuclease
MARATVHEAADDTMPVRHRFTIDEYHRMGEAGIFHEDSRVELIEGDVVHMCPIGMRHIGGVNRLTALFTRRLGSRVVVSVQNPVVLDDYSEPQPDLTLLAFRSDYYEGARPRSSDVLLAIEVADSSVSYDRRIKSVLYARTRVRELWIIDVPGKALDVYRRPTANGYREHQCLVRGRRIAMAAFPRVFFRVAEILG